MKSGQFDKKVWRDKVTSGFARELRGYSVQFNTTRADDGNNARSLADRLQSKLNQETSRFLTRCGVE